MLRRPCLAPGCRALAEPGRSRCPLHRSQRQARKNARRQHAPGNGAAARWRYRLNRRGAGTCAECGLVFAAVRLEVDHRDPLWNGGRDTEGNLQLLCLDCHAEKTEAETRERTRRPTG